MVKEERRQTCRSAAKLWQRGSQGVQGVGLRLYSAFSQLCDSEKVT